MNYRTSGIGSNCVTNPKAINKNNLPFIIIWIFYYTWVLSFVSWWTSSAISENIFSNEIRYLIYGIGLLASGFFMINMKKDMFAKMSWAGAAFLLAGIIAFLIAPSGIIQTVASVITGISLGCISISILIPYVFLLNNTEKIYAVTAGNMLMFLLSVFLYGNPGNIINSQGNFILSLVILIITLSITFFIKNNNKSVFNDNDNHKDTPVRIYMSLFFNCIFTLLGKGVGTALLHAAAEKTGKSIIVLYYAGGLIGCLVFFALYSFVSKPVVVLGNISFVFISFGLLCNMFTMQASGMAVMFALMIGIGNGVGFNIMYFILGVTGKKYNSMTYLKWSVILLGINSGISGVVVGNYHILFGSVSSTIIASVITISVLMFFTIISPVLTEEKYYGGWAKDTEKPEIDNEHFYVFNEYNLSRREADVCKLLLQGYTLRQISAMLSISYSTVNTYCTSLYRKLNINSRAELIILFKDILPK